VNATAQQIPLTAPEGCGSKERMNTTATVGSGPARIDGNHVY
jgi:hypothetical protein